MTKANLLKIAAVVSLSLVVLMWPSTTVFAQSTKVEGLIQGRNGPTMILKTSDMPNLTVLLTESTEVSQVQGVLKARRKAMSMAALIPPMIAGEVYFQPGYAPREAAHPS